MSTIYRLFLFTALLCLTSSLSAQPLRFDFGSEATESGWTDVVRKKGTPLSEPLGLHEHWNARHEYTAIDLIYQRLP